MSIGKSFTPGTRIRLTIAFSLIAVAVSACGGGGGSSSSPANDITPVNITEDADAPIQIPGGPGATPIPDDPIAPVPVTPVSTVRSVENLIGTVTANYGFEGDADRFENTVTFTEDDLLVDPDDGELSLRIEVDSDDGPVSVTCNFLADDVIGLPYFCATLQANPENPFEVFSDNFLFDLTGDLTQGAGNYNFCTYIPVGATEDLESQVESCLIELIIAPDGDTLVEIDRSGLNASAFASRGGLLHSGLDNFADTVNYKIVNDQASGSVSIDQQAPDHVVDALVSKVRSQLGQ